MGNLEKATDMEIALKLASHIKNPCTTLVGDKTYNIREFYLRESRRILPTLDNPHARSFLERVIEKYP